MSRNTLKCVMLSVLPKESRGVENDRFFQALNISDVFFQFLMNVMEM